MATTSQVVTSIQNRITGYSRQQILSVMNEIYEEAYCNDVEQTLYIDPATGQPPYLATQDGVFTYDCPANCRRTDAIFTTEVPRNFSRSRPVGPRRQYYFRNKGYYRIAVSQTKDALPDKDQVATVTFYENPGTTTNVYFHAYYLLVDRLDTENVQLDIQPQVHRQLIRGTIAYLRAEDYGTVQSEAIIEDVVKKIRRELNKGLQGRTGKTPIREEHQEYLVFGYHGTRY
jgi:hypothetical protein